MSTVIARFASRHEAEFAWGLLEDAAIHAAVLIDDAGGTHPNLALTTDARLAVHDEDVARAHSILFDAGVIER